MPAGKVAIFSCADSMVYADPATRSSPAPGSLDMIAYEQQAGLRPKDDTFSDKERRQQVDAHSEPPHLPMFVGCTQRLFV